MYTNCIGPLVCDFDDKKITFGDYVQVIDNAKREVVFQGLVTNIKVQCHNDDDSETDELEENERMFSIDDKYFFKLDDAKYTVVKLAKNFVNKEFIRKNYTVQSWGSCCDVNRDDIDIFIEHSIDELDEEVKSIVNTLNKFSMNMKTTGSCSGHGKGYAWVTILFNNSRVLEDFLSVFEPYKYKMEFTSSQIITNESEIFRGKPFFPSSKAMLLRTKDVGEQAYKVLDEFAEYLNKIIDIRNKTYVSLDNIIKQEKKQQINQL